MKDPEDWHTRTGRWMPAFLSGFSGFMFVTGLYIAAPTIMIATYAILAVVSAAIQLHYEYRVGVLSDD